MALAAGKHAFLEKPPGATVSEVEMQIALAKLHKVTPFASWHQRLGGAVAVCAATHWIAQNAITSINIYWNEDIRQWHPGQNWILQSGGFGLFDPGINALSIVTEIVREPIRMIDATLHIPTNRQAPIAAKCQMSTVASVPISATFDFLQTGRQLWVIIVHASEQRLHLSRGGNQLSVTGTVHDSPAEAEYPSMYRHFVNLVSTGKSHVDLAPL